MIIALPKQIRDVVEQNDNLTRYLLGLSKEVPHTKRSWLYEDIPAQQVLDNWLNILGSLENGDSFEKRVFQFDTSQLEKWGPQGGHAPIAELYPKLIEPTFQKHSPASAFSTPEWRKALVDFESWLATEYGIRQTRLASYKRVADDMRARDTLSSNSGYPDFTRRNLTKRAAILAASSGAWENYPAIALFRNYNLKTRLVWMFPMATNIVEASVAQPIQSGIMKIASRIRHSFFDPWVGFDRVRDTISKMYDTQPDAYIAATDFSATDEHFREETSVQVEELLSGLLSVTGHPTLIDTIHNMHNIPLLISPTEMVVGEHGLASGSIWTNFLETLFDGIFAGYVEQHLDNKMYGLYAIGDDMAWIGNRSMVDAFPRLAESLGQTVGQQINAEKVTSNYFEVKTLQRLFQRGYRRPDGLTRGVYSTIRALKSSIFPEKFHKPRDWSSDMFCARQFMIMENCVDHPLFEKFVKFIVKGQRDLVPFAQKSASELKRITQETKLLPG